jgi:hypothetical protein
MNCNDALEKMLDAEPAELALAVETPLAEHIRGCRKCAAVAARLVGVTAVIADVAAAAPTTGARRRSSAGRRVVIGAGLAAAAALAFVAQRGPSPVAIAPVIGRSLGSDAPVERRVVPPGDVPVVTAVRMAPAKRFTSVRFEAAARIAAPAIAEIAATPRNVPPVEGISVAPPAGVRATVVTTSDPTVTVVWLHPADTTRSPR